MPSRITNPSLRKRRSRSDLDLRDILDQLNRNNLATVTLQDENGTQRGFRINIGTGIPQYHYGGEWKNIPTSGKIIQTIERSGSFVSVTGGGGGGTDIHNELNGLQGGIATPAGGERYHLYAPTAGALAYGNGTTSWVNLAGDTSNTRKFLRGLSVAGVAQAPAWDTLAAGDIETIQFWSRNAVSGYLYPTTLTDYVGIGVNNPDRYLLVRGSVVGRHTAAAVNATNGIGVAWGGYVAAGPTESTVAYITPYSADVPATTRFAQGLALAALDAGSGLGWVMIGTATRAGTARVTVNGAVLPSANITHNLGGTGAEWGTCFWQAWHSDQAASYLDHAGILYFRDPDASYATRATYASATGYWNFSGRIGIGGDPSFPLHVNVTSAAPSTANPIVNAGLRVHGSATNVIDMNTSGTSPYPSWIQSRDRTNGAIYYPLWLNPSGGQVVAGAKSLVHYMGNLKVDGTVAGQVTLSHEA